MVLEMMHKQRGHSTGSPVAGHPDKGVGERVRFPHGRLFTKQSLDAIDNIHHTSSDIDTTFPAT